MKTLFFVFSLVCGVHVEEEEIAMLQTKMQTRGEDSVIEAEDVKITMEENVNISLQGGPCNTFQCPSGYDMTCSGHVSTTNVARGKSVSGCSQSSRYGSFSRATDGITRSDNRWHMDQGGSNCWLQVDLGAEYIISGMKTTVSNHANYGARSISVTAAGNNRQFRHATSKGGCCGSMCQNHFGGWSFPTRYIKMSLNGLCGGNHHAISEWEVYGGYSCDTSKCCKERPTTTTTTENCHDANGRNICFCSTAGCPEEKACCIAGFAGVVTEFDAASPADRTSCVQAGSSWCEGGLTYCGDGTAPHDPANCDESPGEGTDVVGEECLDADDGFGPDFSCANTTMFCSHDSGSGLTVGECCPQECRKIRKEAERKRKEARNKNKNQNQEYWRKNKEKNMKAEHERKKKRRESTNKRKNAEVERKRKKADEEWKAKRAWQEQRNKIEEGERKDKRGMSEARRKTEHTWKQTRREKKGKANDRERNRKEARNKVQNGNNENQIKNNFNEARKKDKAAENQKKNNFNEARKKDKAAENEAKKGCLHEKNFKKCASQAGCERGQKKKGNQEPPPCGQR